MLPFEVKRGSVSACLAALGLAPACILTAQMITEYPVPTADADLGGIVAGPDGAVWFTEYGGHKIGRIAMDGSVTEYPLTPESAGPIGIATGPDGNLWFTEYAHYPNSRIGRMTTMGTLTEFAPSGDETDPIIAGPDGNLWFGKTRHFGDLEFGTAGRVSTTGVFADDFQLSPGGVTGMVAGPDGNVWFVQPQYTHHLPYPALLGRITPAGEVMNFYLNFQFQSLGPPAVGPDGNIWLGACQHQYSGPCFLLRVTTQGELMETFPVAAAGLAAGPDEALWFTDPAANRIGRITMDGGFAFYDVPTADSGLSRMTAGPDGAMWFTEYTANQIGRIVPQAPTPTPLPSFTPTPAPSPTPSPTPVGTGGGGSTAVPAMSAVSVFALLLGLAAAGLWVNRSR